jgi:hypothetical protein
MASGSRCPSSRPRLPSAASRDGSATRSSRGGRTASSGRSPSTTVPATAGGYPSLAGDQRPSPAPKLHSHVGRIAPQRTNR